MKLLIKVAIMASLMPVFGDLSASVNCHNRHHSHCAHSNCHHNCHGHYFQSKPRFDLSFSINTPIYEPRFVERSYYRPVSRPVTSVVTTYVPRPVREVRTYSRPAYEARTYSSYGYPYGVCETRTVYSNPVSVYETVSIESPVVVYETIERHGQHPVSAAFNFASAMIDAFAD